MHFVHFEVENEKLNICCFDVLVLHVETIKMSYQTKHLKIGILLFKKKKTQKWLKKTYKHIQQATHILGQHTKFQVCTSKVVAD